MNDQLPVGGNGSPAVEELRRRAEDARADLADSLRALRTRLSPQELLARAKASVQDRAVQTSANATTRLRQGARTIRREVVGRGQRAMGVARKRPVAVAAASAVLARVAWYVVRHRNGHERGVGTPTQRSGRSAGSGSASVSGNSDGLDADGDFAVNMWDLPAAMPAPVVRPRSTGRLWTAGAAAAFLTSVVAAGRSARDATPDAEKAREHSGRAAGGAGRAVPTGSMRAGPAAIAGAIAATAAAMLLPRWRAEARLSMSVQQAARGALSASGRRLVDHARRSLGPTVSALLHTTPGRLPGD